MRLFSVSAIAALSVAGAAVAQGPVKVGAPIVGKAGEAIGTVASVDGDTISIKVADGSTFGLPAAGFTVEGDRVVAAWSKA